MQAFATPKLLRWVAMSVVTLIGSVIDAPAAGAADSELAGPGIRIVLRPTKGQTAREAQLAEAVVQSRVGKVVDASIRHEGKRLVVVLPGVTDPSIAKRLVVPSEVRFRPVLLGGLAPPGGRDDPAASAAIASCDPNAVASLPAIATTSWIEDSDNACVVLPQRSGEARRARYYLGPASLTGRAVRSARAEFVTSAGWIVNIKLTPAGSKRFDQLARDQFHKQVAVVVDGIVEFAPTIQPGEAEFSSFGGTILISSSYSQREAKRVAETILFSRLPPLFTIEETTITP
jgi:preprotein translocase subunit SecD